MTLVYFCINWTKRKKNIVMAKKKKILIRIPTPPKGGPMKDKSKYSRKKKHKGRDDGR